jgi:hypothetical protein
MRPHIVSSSSDRVRAGHGRGTVAGPLAGAVLGVGVLLVAGCETIGQDMNDIAKSIMPPSPSEAARMALDPHDPDRRRDGTLLLANAPWGGNPPYLEMYRDYAEHESDPLVRAVAIRALARHGTAEDAASIAGQLEHDNMYVRWEAAKGLQRLHDPDVVAALLKTVRDTQEVSDVRVAAVLALGQYHEDRVFQGLLVALDTRELAVNRAAERSLHILTGQAFGLDPKSWLNWYESTSDDPFAGGQEYLYPTYQRDETWIEKLAFWSNRIEEHPGPPAGLRPSQERRTYQEDVEADDG